MTNEGDGGEIIDSSVDIHIPVPQRFAAGHMRQTDLHYVYHYHLR